MRGTDRRSIRIDLFAEAGPIAAYRLVQTASTFAGAIMVGRLGSVQLAAAGLAGGVAVVVFIFAQGTLFCLSPLITAARKRGDDAEVRDLVRHGLLQAFGLGVVLSVVLVFVGPALRLLGQDAAVVDLVESYFRGVVVGVVPVLGVTVFQQLFLAFERAQLLMVYAVLRLPVAVVLAYALIFGAFGAPELGMPGLGWSIGIVNLVGFVCLGSYVAFADAWRDVRLLRGPLAWRRSMQRHLATMGLPIGGQYVGEVGAVLLAVVMIGWVGHAELAAFHIVHQYVSIVLTVVLGLAQGAPVVVSAHLAGNRAAVAATAGAIAIRGAVALMLVPVVLFLAAPGSLTEPFLPTSGDAHSVASFTQSFFAIAAASVMFDAVRSVMSGLLRSYENTLGPLRASLTGFWIVGIPVGACLAFPLDWGGDGVALGIAIGSAVAAVLVRRIYVAELRSS